MNKRKKKKKHKKAIAIVKDSSKRISKEMTGSENQLLLGI